MTERDHDGRRRSGVWLPDQCWDWLDATSQRDGTSRSDLLEGLVLLAIDGRPTDGPTEADRRTSLATERLVSAISTHVAKTHEPLAAGKDPAIAAQVFSEDSVKLLLNARELLRALAGGRPATPDRGQVAEVIAGNIGRDCDDVQSAADAVLDLLSRSAAEPEVTHACPPGDAGLTPCCGRTPFELPLTDRMTLDAALVTCGTDSNLTDSGPRCGYG